MHYKDAFFGMADELYGRTSGERRCIENEKPRMVDGTCDACSGGEAGSMEDDRRL